jgi:hypothetical protein
VLGRDRGYTHGPDVPKHHEHGLVPGRAGVTDGPDPTRLRRLFTGAVSSAAVLLALAGTPLNPFGMPEADVTELASELASDGPAESEQPVDSSGEPAPDRRDEADVEFVTVPALKPALPSDLLAMAAAGFAPR